MRSSRQADGTRLRVRVQPRAASDTIAGWELGVLRVRVTAPPVEGAANQALIALLARALGVPRAAVSIVRGDRSRDKLVAVGGLSRAEIEARLA